jgi:hypothetical protein
VVIFTKLVNLRWVNSVLLPLVVILMEVFWIYPCLAWAGKWSALTWQRQPLSLASLVFLLGVTFLATRFFLGRRWPLYWIRLSIIACGLIAMFVVVRIEYGTGTGLLSGQWFVQTALALLDSYSHPHPMVIALLVGVFLWWRGISWGRSPLYSETIYRSFLFGLAALVVLILVWGAGWGADPFKNLVSTVGLYVVGFFFCGLTALALTNLQGIQQQMKEKEGTALVFSRRWLFIIVGVIGGIVLAGIGAASMFSAEFVALLGRLLNIASGLLFKLLEYLLIPIGYLVAGLFYAGQFIINLLAKERAPLTFSSENLTGIGQLPQVIPKALSPEAILAIKWGFFSLVIAGVLFLLARAILRYWSYPAKDEVEEISESLWSWEGFKADLRLFFSLLRQRYRRQSHKVTVGSHAPGKFQWQGVEVRLDIREIYRRLLWQASDLKIARRHQETPYEYAERLGQAVPEGGVPLSELTNLYVNVRYGDLEAEPRQVDYANSLWRILQRLLGGIEGRQTE